MATHEYLNALAPAPRKARKHGFFAAGLPLMFALAFIWPFGGGGTKVQMTPNAGETPAAQGTLTVRKGSNNNTRIDTKVKNLATPASLKHPAQVYVEWIQPNGQSPKNEGEIMIAPNRSGQLKTETPYQHFKVFITAEKSPTVTSPKGPHVLTATVD